MRYTDDEKAGMEQLRRALGLADTAIIHERLEDLTDFSLGRVFIQACRALDRDRYKGARPPEMTPDFRAMQWAARLEAWLEVNDAALIEVIDWLLTAAADRHAWIERVDAFGRPKKLMKCGDLAALHAEAARSLARLHKDKLDVVLGPDDETCVRDLGNGFTLVRLLSPAALDVEGQRMRHCLGNGWYDGNLEERYGYSYYSVRDDKGAPQATLEIVSTLVAPSVGTWTVGVIRQFQAVKNTIPEPHILARVFAVAADMNWIRKEDAKTVVDDNDEDLALLRDAFARGHGLR